MKILVVCTGNRCRSQMAHGILKSIDPTLTVCSAGTRPASEVHPLGIKVMKEIGIDISSHYPKSIDQYIGEEWDYVITVCGGAKESCPVFTGKVGKRLHIGFDDPDSFKGTDKHGKTKCARFQKRKAYFPTKNEMRFEKHFISIKKASEHKFQMPFFFSITSDIQVEFDIL